MDNLECKDCYWFSEPWCCERDGGFELCEPESEACKDFEPKDETE